MVFLTFVFCWAPFFILNTVVGVCGQTCAPPHFMMEMALWLGYGSSTINPLIYTGSIYRVGHGHVKPKMMKTRNANRNKFAYLLIYYLWVKPIPV